MAKKIYKESKIELTPLIAKHYDRIMNSISFGKYNKFIRKAIRDMDIKPEDQILDLGCGTGKNAGLMSEFLGYDGHITGIDVSAQMEDQFLWKHQDDDRISFIRQRIDQPFDLNKKFDKVLISFVIHGFPHEVREEILKNAHKHLRPEGKLIILDFSEFELERMPYHHRVIFKAVECKYAFDYIARDWNSVLKEFGFSHLNQHLYFRSYARLLVSSKN